jgi:hypothetical protein
MARGVLGHDHVADVARLFVAQVVVDVAEAVLDRHAAPAQEVAALAADRADGDVAALGLELVVGLERRLADARVERAGEAAVAGQHDQQHVLGLAPG